MLHALKLDERAIQYSAIVLFEEKNRNLFSGLLNSLHEVLCSTGLPYEIIIISNGPFVILNDIISSPNEYNSTIKIFELSQKATETECFKAGFEESSGNIIISCGSYQQITEYSFAELINSLENNIDFVCSWRNTRHDSSLYKVRSKIFNYLVRTITKSEFHDSSSSVRVFRRMVIEETDIYGNMLRFLPLLAACNGFKGKEIKCNHYYQKDSTTQPFYFTKYIERIIDIFTIYFISRFRSKPLRFFGFLGVVFLASGILTNLYVLIDKVFFGLSIGNRPFLPVGMILMVIGVLAASIGLLGEIITFVHGRHKKTYTIEKII